MDDRKRLASQAHDDSGPPLKKPATAVNGASRADRDAEMPWKDELERFQKDAIWRQMQEYKRERNHLESRVNEMIKSAAYHDDHLRIIDAWWRQLLEEISLLVGDGGNKTQDPTLPTYSSSIFFSGVETFQSHLDSRSRDIKSAVDQLYKCIPQVASPEVSELQGRISKMLAAEKVHQVELERLGAERDTLQDRLENASLRYMMAEKKLDRAKSVAVAKLERQAIQGGSNDSGSGLGGSIESAGGIKKETSETVNGIDDHSDVNDGAEADRKEALAVAEKRQEQLAKLESDNTQLNQKVSTLTVKLANLSDDDYARTELFQHMKSQYEDVVKRINHLEATNVELREEAKKLQAERTAYRDQVDREAQAPLGEMEAQLSRAESDLARVRTARDELNADVAIRKSTQEKDRATYDQIKELAAARDDRIRALESEIERLRIHTGQTDGESPTRVELGDLGIEDLRRKLQNLEREYILLNNELPSMGAAWKKASALASKKVWDAAAMEEKVSRLQAEKAKADQKYFATMKLKESRESEVRTLRSQNAKSAEIVAQLKEVETSTRHLVVNLEKQLAETKDSLVTLETQQRNMQSQVLQGNSSLNGVKSQLAELGSAFKEKDASLSAIGKAQRESEALVEQLKARLDEKAKQLDVWKGKATSNQSEEFEMLRNLALCTVCRSRFKNTALKLCGHVFCKECVDERIESRSRKCPNCSRSYGKADVMTVHM